MTEASSQVKQMIQFITLEANEKAEEIRVKTDAEYEAQYQEHKRTFDKKLADEFTAKREQREVEKRIKASHEKQAAIFSVMELRDQKMNELKSEVIEKLGNINEHPDYSKLIIHLIVQGLLRIQEEKVLVRCRKVDEPIVSKVLREAAELYKKTVKASTGHTPKLEELKIDSVNLYPPYSSTNTLDFSLGGVILVARNGRILCKNTLEARLETAFHQLKPQIRSILFGEREAKNNNA